MCEQLIWQDSAGLLFLEYDGTMYSTVVLHDATALTFPASVSRWTCYSDGTISETVLLTGARAGQGGANSIARLIVPNSHSLCKEEDDQNAEAGLSNNHGTFSTQQR